jgi:ankyrin repeat protein
MVEILAIENGYQGGFSPEERMPDPTDVMTVCSSLICLNPNNLQNGSGEDGHRILIQLAHFSVKEFLLSNRCDFELDFQPRICHLAIAESCLHYLLHLCRNMPLTKELINQYPLSVYAAKQWWRHIQSITGVLDDTFLDLASNLLMKENHLLSWIQLYDMDRSWQRFDPSFKTKDLEQPLYYAAHIGVPAVVERIMARSFDVNAQGGNYGNALQAASYRGHGTVVKMLLDAGADVNLQGGKYGNALQAASYRGHGTVVKMLLIARADINAQGGSHDNALYTASFKGHDTVVKILLDAGADVNTQGGCYGNALQAASLPGHDTVVKILVDGGADINTQGGCYGNALQAALSQGHDTVVKILVDRGADINAQGSDDGDTLQTAIISGYEAQVWKPFDLALLDWEQSSISSQ